MTTQKEQSTKYRGERSRVPEEVGRVQGGRGVDGMGDFSRQNGCLPGPRGQRQRLSKECGPYTILIYLIIIQIL